MPRLQPASYMDRVCSHPKCDERATCACEFDRDSFAYQSWVEQIVTRYYCEKHARAFAKRKGLQWVEYQPSVSHTIGGFIVSAEEYEKRWKVAHALGLSLGQHMYQQSRGGAA